MEYYLVIMDYLGKDKYAKYKTKADTLPRKGERIDFEIEEGKSRSDLELKVLEVKYSLQDTTKRLMENEADEDDLPMVVTKILSKRPSSNK